MLSRFEAEVLYAAHKEEFEALMAQWNDNATKGDNDRIKWRGRKTPAWHKKYKRMWLALEAKLGGENPSMLLTFLKRWKDNGSME